jgi:hypothetical protein
MCALGIRVHMVEIGDGFGEAAHGTSLDDDHGPPRQRPDDAGAHRIDRPA